MQDSINMSIEKVREYLKQFNRENDIIELDQSSATVQLAAKALNVEPERIAKTLSFKTSDGAVLVVTAGDARIDNKKFKSQFGLKAKMLTPEEVIELTGHAIGGVCPFAIENSKVKIYLDDSLKRFGTVYPACGSGNSAIKLTLPELERLSNSSGWIDVTKIPIEQ